MKLTDSDLIRLYTAISVIAEVQGDEILHVLGVLTCGYIITSEEEEELYNFIAELQSNLLKDLGQ